ncbi:MAG: RsmB/NOP family class I SAM-dependent RNA methyltransferase [Desulfurococcaceae archaeon]
MKLNYDELVSVLASTLYTVMNKHVSVRKAFTSTCRRLRCSGPELPRETVFQLARSFISNYYRVKYIAEKCGKRKPSYRLLARLYLHLHGEEYGIKHASRLEKAVRRDFPALNSVLAEFMEGWARLSYPEWFYNELASLIPKHEVEELLEAMNKRVFWIRVNTLKADVDKVLRTLEKEGVEGEQDPEIPFLIRISKTSKPLRTLSLFKEGVIILQDKASVLAVMALRPEPRMLIYDYAAAPGVKASLIMQLTENRARIVAADISQKRLEAMERMLKLYGVDRSRVVLTIADSRDLKLERRADLALVDAPCTSSGAVSKDPAIKIFLNNRELVYAAKSVQVGLLHNALRQVDRVVYATCSLLPEEGEEVVEDVLRRGVEQRVRDAGIKTRKGYAKYSIWNHVHRTMPHLDMCEGFFVARFEK